MGAPRRDRRPPRSRTGELKRLFHPRASDAMAASALALRLTAVILVFQPVPIWYLRPLLLSLAILALLFPSALRMPALWGAVTLLLAVWVVRVWPMADNHNYLFVYWTLAIFLALCSRQPDRALAKSAVARSRIPVASVIVRSRSKPCIAADSAAPSRPCRSNSSRSKLELTWMSIDGVAVGETVPVE